MLIIGSAAGVVVMGLEKITFVWYMKKITWIAFVGYIAGILCYYVLREVHPHFAAIIQATFFRQSII